MRILCVTPIYPPEVGGPAGYVSGLQKHLPAKHSLKVITFSPYQENSNPDHSVVSIPLHGSPVKRQTRLFKAILHHATEQQVIYAQGTVTVGFASLVAARLKKLPLVIKFVGDEIWETARNQGKTQQTMEEFYHLNQKSLTLSIHRLVLQSANRIITPSEYLKNFLMKAHGLNSNRIDVINNPVEIPEIKTKKIPHQLVTVGRLVSWKNIDQIIQAVTHARQEKPWTLQIVGDGPRRKELEAQVKHLNAGKYIFFTGSLNKTDTLQKIKQSEKLILYSDYEGQSHTLIEAMLLGTPIIASNIPPNRELVGDRGQLVSLNQPNALAQAIIRPYAKTTPFASESFSWKNHLGTLVNLLKKEHAHA